MKPSLSSFQKNRKIFLLFGAIFFFASVMLFIGAKTKVFLGDEIHHYRFAKESFVLGERAVYDSLFGPVIPPGYYFSTEPLWPLGLAAFTKAIGQFSQTAAQLYQTAFFILFIFSVFLLARELYGSACAGYAAFLAATIPMVTTFGVLLYVDLPAAAFVAFTFLFLYRRQYLRSGITFGLLYLTKRSGAFFVPSIVLLVAFDPLSKILQKMKALLCFFAGSVLIIFPDILWRRSHFSLPSQAVSAMSGGQVMPQGGHFQAGTQAGTFLSGALHSVDMAYRQGMALIWERMRGFTSWRFWEVKEYLNSSLMNPKDVVSYFGPVFLFLFLGYFVRRRFSSKDIFLWVPAAVFMLVFAFVFRLASDIRYVLPALPLFVILAAKNFEAIQYPRFKRALAVICIFQFAVVCVYISQIRQPSADLKAGLAYIQNQTSPDAIMVYPEANLVEHADRKIMWGLGGVLNLFWMETEEEMMPCILQNKIDYIVIKKNRIYTDDNGKHRHHGGYPQSFVDRLAHLSRFKLVFDNSALSIWKINRQEQV